MCMTIDYDVSGAQRRYITKGGGYRADSVIPLTGRYIGIRSLNRVDVIIRVYVKSLRFDSSLLHPRMIMVPRLIILSNRVHDLVLNLMNC